MLVENYSNSRSLQTHSAAEAIFSDLRVKHFLEYILRPKKRGWEEPDRNLVSLHFRGSDYRDARAQKINLPGWRWAAIKKVALDRLSRSLHSDVCDSDGCCDAVVHSTISGGGNRRARAVPNVIYIECDFCTFSLCLRLHQRTPVPLGLWAKCGIQLFH